MVETLTFEWVRSRRLQVGCDGEKAELVAQGSLTLTQEAKSSVTSSGVLVEISVTAAAGHMTL